MVIAWRREDNHPLLHALIEATQTAIRTVIPRKSSNQPVVRRTESAVTTIRFWTIATDGQEQAYLMTGTDEGGNDFTRRGSLTKN